MTGIVELPQRNYAELSPKARFITHELAPHEIDFVQKARAHYLIEHKLIDVAQTENGAMKDAYPDRSIWIGAEKPGSHFLEAAGRLILPEHDSVDTLQIQLDNIVNPNEELIHAIRQHSATEIGEVASLLQIATDPQSSLYVYAGLKHVSDQHGIRFWLMGLRHRSELSFAKIFGPALHRMGDSVTIEGAKEELVPYLINVDEGVASIRQSLEEGIDDRFTRMGRQLFIDALDSIPHPPVAA